MKQSRPGTALTVAILVVAGLCTLAVTGGWLIWIPTLAALAVHAALRRKWNS